VHEEVRLSKTQYQFAFLKIPDGRVICWYVTALVVHARRVFGRRPGRAPALTLTQHHCEPDLATVLASTLSAHGDAVFCSSVGFHPTQWNLHDRQKSIARR